MIGDKENENQKKEMEKKVENETQNKHVKRKENAIKQEMKEIIKMFTQQMKP